VETKTLLEVFGESDVHLFECDLVECPGHFQSFRLLILAQTLACRIIQLAELFSRVVTTGLEQRLRLVDLFLRGAKDRAAFGLFGCGLGRRV